MKIHIFILALLLFIHSCSNKTEQKNKELDVDTISVVEPKGETDSTEYTQLKKSLPFLVSMINFDSIKVIYENANTSGVLTICETNIFKREKAKDIFGIYFFTSSTERIPYLGKAIITTDQKQWDYSNSEEELIEFSSYSNTLNPFYSLIRIGDTKKQIFKVFGEDYQEVETSLIYYDDNGNAVSFLIESERVKAIRVGVYNNPQKLNPNVLKW